VWVLESPTSRGGETGPNRGALTTVRAILDRRHPSGAAATGGCYMRTSRMLLIGLIAVLPITSAACTYDEQLTFFSYLGCVVVPVFTGQPCTGPTLPGL
jgi:hypothetical protein